MPPSSPRVRTAKETTQLGGFFKNTIRLGWEGELHDGHHEAIIAKALFDRAAGICRDRAADLNGRNWHSQDTRPLTGVIECAACGSRMVGSGPTCRGKSTPYYACSKRMGTHGCDQAYIRAGVLERGIIDDVKAMFQDEHFLDQLWAEAERLLTQEKLEIEHEIAAVDA